MNQVNSAGVQRNKMVYLSLAIILASVAIVGGIIAWSVLGSSGRMPKEEVNKGKQIKDATPSEVNKEQEKSEPEDDAAIVKTKKYKDMTREEKLAYYRNKYGDNIPDNLKPIVYYLENEPKEHYRGRTDKTSIFKHHSENIIASYLAMEPGTWVMRPTEYDAKFDNDFAKAIKEDIKILSDDSEEVRNLKQAVIEAKAYMQEEAKKGKAPSEIMTETSKEMYILGQYKRDLAEEISALKRDPNKSDDDVLLAVEAANKMLEKKGLKPLRQPNMMIRRANLKRAKARSKGTTK